MKCNKLLLVIGFLFLAGCGEEEPQRYLVSNPEFDELKAEFIKDYQEYRMQSINPDLIVINFDMFGELKGDGLNHAGCRKGLGEVVVDGNFWTGAYNIRYKKAIIYHELGHCVLGIEGHRTGDSIMRQYLSKYFVIEDYHLRELFDAPIN